MKPDSQSAPGRGGPVGPATCVFYTWDVPTGTLRWGGNPAGVLGRPGADLPDTFDGLLACAVPDDQAFARGAFDALLADRRPIRLEFCVRWPDGRPVPVAAHAAFTGPDLVVGSIARQAAGSGPRDPPPADAASGDGPAQDREASRFFNLSEDYFCVAGFDGYFRRVNPAFGRGLGYTADELLARPFAEFIHPDDRAATRAAADRLARGHAPVQFRNRYRTAHGPYRWLEWAARAAPGEGVVFAVGRDVTGWVEREEQLRFRVARKQAILNNTTAVVYVKDRQGRYEFINAQFAKLFHLSPSGVAGKTDADIFPPAFAAKFRAVDQRVLQFGESVQLEEVAPHSDGPHTYVSVKFPLRNAGGEVVALAGISTDITDRLRAEGAEAQLRTAGQLQRRLYPAAAPDVPGFEAAGRGRSASQLCGDYFDYIPRGDGRVVLAVGDVCGHGLGPALTMVETRAALRLLLQTDDRLDAVLARLNRQLHCDAGDSLFLSLFLAEIDPAARVLTWGGAGHVGYLLRADGADVRLTSTGPVLGVLDPVEFEPAPETGVGAGDVLVLFTDGLTEVMAPGGELFGTPRLLDVIRRHREATAAEIIDRVFAAVAAHAGSQPTTDDMTAIVLKAR